MPKIRHATALVAAPPVYAAPPRANDCGLRGLDARLHRFEGPITGHDIVETIAR